MSQDPGMIESSVFVSFDKSLTGKLGKKLMLIVMLMLKLSTGDFQTLLCRSLTYGDDLWLCPGPVNPGGAPNFI
jgi:hypothetical protein